jgi:hypothetical protein
MVAPIGSRPPSSVSRSSTSEPATSQAKSAATSSSATGFSAVSGFDSSSKAGKSQVAKDFEQFLGEASTGKGDGSSYAKMFGGNDSNIARNVKTATDDFKKWLSANPNATDEQLKKKVDDIKSSFGSHIMADQNFESYLFSNLLSAMKHVNFGGEE